MTTIRTKPMTKKKELQSKEFELPTTDLFRTDELGQNEDLGHAALITEKLRELGIEGEIRDHVTGPFVTTYWFVPKHRSQIQSVIDFEEDLALALGVECVRIERSPGRAVAGIEIPNRMRGLVRIDEVLDSPAFRCSPSKLTVALGKTTTDKPFIIDLETLTNLLIAGRTGSGKSVCLKTLIASILFKASPHEVKLVLVDPRRNEFFHYRALPHLLTPIIHNPYKAVAVIREAVRIMEMRYRALAAAGAENIEEYNRTRSTPNSLMPFIVVIVDEFTNLMMAAADDLEDSIGRLATLAQAVGIHLVFATQSPSADVISGMVKNAFPSRIAFRVPSKINSRIILDAPGAEKLLGTGDMLFMPSHSKPIVRLHGSYISTTETNRLVDYFRIQGGPEYDEQLIALLKEDPRLAADGIHDERYEIAVKLILQTGQASASYLQRRLKMGFDRASRIIDVMESEGILNPSEGNRPRIILMNLEEWKRKNRSGLMRV